MKEWHRTVILLVLLALGIGFLVWSTHQADTILFTTP
jgi:hypothetical protein